jgi:hypothetical protein
VLELLASRKIAEAPIENFGMAICGSGRMIGHYACGVRFQGAGAGKGSIADQPH